MKHSPKVFFVSILVFSVLYWMIGPEHFVDNMGKFVWTPEGGQQFKIRGNKFVDYVYFAIVTQSLLGYGDIVPATRLCRLFVCLQIMISMFLLLGTGSAVLVSSIAGNSRLSNIRRG